MMPLAPTQVYVGAVVIVAVVACVVVSVVPVIVVAFVVSTVSAVLVAFIAVSVLMVVVATVAVVPLVGREMRFLVSVHHIAAGNITADTKTTIFRRRIMPNNVLSRHVLKLLQTARLA